MCEPIETMVYNGFEIQVFPDESSDIESPREWGRGTLAFWGNKVNHLSELEDDYKNVPADNQLVDWLCEKIMNEDDLYGIVAYDSEGEIDLFSGSRQLQCLRVRERLDEVEFDLSRYADAFIHWLDAMGDKVIVRTVFRYEHGMVAFSTRSFLGRAHHADWDSGPAGFIFVETKDLVKPEWGYTEPITEEIREEVLKYFDVAIEVFSAWANGDVYWYKILDPDGETIDSCGGYIGYDQIEKFIFPEGMKLIDSYENKP